MPPLERFSRGRESLEKLGQVQVESMDPSLLVGTRAFLTKERMVGTKRRHSILHAEVVMYEGIPYVIDGHHKARRAIQTATQLPARVLYTSDKLIGRKIQRMKTDFISELPIRG